jgi:hypothetical protein
MDTRFNAIDNLVFNPPTPHPLLDHLKKQLNFEWEEQLAEWFECSPSTLSRLRTGKKRFDGDFILHVYDHTFMTIEEIRALLGEK